MRDGHGNAWKGGRVVRADGYIQILTPEHPRADRHGYALEHVLVVERAMGKYLRRGAPVHHVDENRSNNDRLNLVACDSYGYHQTLHRRLRALKACGDPNAMSCKYCKSYSRQNDFPLIGETGVRARYHRDCQINYMKDYRKRGIR